MKRTYVGVPALLLVLAFGLNAMHANAAKVNRSPATFSSGELRLEGTLWRPKLEQPVPAVVVIHGSGSEPRKSLRHFAKAFSSHGIAVLLYDKRGTGASEGDPEAWRYFDLEALAEDAAAGVRWLAEQPGIDHRKIGVVGVSPRRLDRPDGGGA